MAIQLSPAEIEIPIEIEICTERMIPIEMKPPITGRSLRAWP
jgi:hypothetical protein